MKAKFGASLGRSRRAHGIALVLVMWVLALLTVMALGLTTTQRTQAALTANQVDAARFVPRPWLPLISPPLTC
jgi:Tfp pilus assembly protein PilX